MSLHGYVADVCNLDNNDIKQMYALMVANYENTEFERFLKDLDEKSWVVILKDEAEEIKGFTTMKILNAEVDGKDVYGLFSGDTIIHKNFVGELSLPRIWAPFVLELSRKYEPSPLYWFLISKGHRTYKFLPAYFKSYYPSCRWITPDFEKRVMDAFALSKYPDRYNSSVGIIYSNGREDYLRSGVADITEQQSKNPDVKFFMEKNPGYQSGDELVCLARYNLDNLKPAAVRILFGGASC